MQGSKNHDAKSPRAHAAAMTVQKNWRNHQNKDLSKDRDVERVQHLKEEVSLKSDMSPEKEIGGLKKKIVKSHGFNFLTKFV